MLKVAQKSARGVRILATMQYPSWGGLPSDINKVMNDITLGDSIGNTRNAIKIQVTNLG